MSTATTIYGGYVTATFRRSSSQPKTTSQSKPTPIARAAGGAPLSLYISINPSDVNPVKLRHLYDLCNYSCHRFPKVDCTGRVEPIDENKLPVALSHSSVVVSAFSRPDSDPSSSSEAFPLFIQKMMMPISPENGHLVGFGRAVSDFGLTASIYDVMVHPSFQNRGIGRIIIQRIIRELTRRGVYDIAALCSAEERCEFSICHWNITGSVPLNFNCHHRSFFGACGFGDDVLGSTTMMYTRTRSRSSEEDDEQVVSVGRKLLLLPPVRETSQLSISNGQIKRDSS